MKNPSHVVVALFAATLAVPVAKADLVLNEQFLTGTDPSAGQYNTDPLVRLNAQGPTVQGYNNPNGWTSGAGTSQTHVVDNTLDAPGASYEAGGKVQFDGSPVDNLYRSNARTLATPYAQASANGPVFLSGMINTDAFPAPTETTDNTGKRGYALFGFTNAIGAVGSSSTIGTLAGYYLGFRATATDTVDLVLRHRQGTAATTQEDIVLFPGASVGTTYQFLVKTDVNVIGGNQETVHWWINPADVTSEATATSSALASGTFNDFSLQSANADILRTTVATYNWDTNVFFDEFRLGTTFADVAGPPVAPPHITGDTNNDGVVDLNDLNNVLNNFGGPGPNNPGDDDNNGVVDLNDLNNVLNNFGAHAAAAALSVPEPASIAACGLALLPLLRRRPR